SKFGTGVTEPSFDEHQSQTRADSWRYGLWLGQAGIHCPVSVALQRKAQRIRNVFSATSQLKEHSKPSRRPTPPRITTRRSCLRHRQNHAKFRRVASPRLGQ